ncbi:GGDEF domain-containing protein [Streptomyces sp. NP160]|uniref:GGDEF domain-containing protein n=1 Tax=Streptomyces sp. NP160 TaxID=2586637 RepID=UPI00111A196C|nr:GGDEF domain-containing protein [Streptomyces sp. NP160]TNM70281.1 GGDEF domain-containing protein [Streptomyces sp. NP160]
MHHRRLTDRQRPGPQGPPSPTEPSGAPDGPGVPEQRGPWRRLLPLTWLAGAAALLMAAVGPLRARLGVPPVVGQAVVDLLLAALSVAVLVLFVRRSLRTARSGGGRRRTVPWVVFSAAMAFYAAAQGRFAALELLTAADPRRDPGTIACYLAASVLAPVAVVLAVRAVHPSTSRLRTLLDGLLAGGGLFVLSWLGVLGAALASGDVPLAVVVFTAGTVVGAVVIVTASMALAVRCRQTPSVVLLAAGSVLMAVCQVTFLLLVRSGSFTPGGWISVGYVLALVAFVAAAVVEDGDGPARARPRLRGPLAVLPYLPLLVAVAAVLVESTRRQLGLVELASTLVLTTVLVLRQALVVLENGRLNRELRDRSAALAHLAYTDQLTGLANRTAFTGALQEALDSAVDRGRSVVVAFCDLDGFKAVNDACGHAAGDALLVAASRRLREAVRSGDVVARLGGDEFAVLVEDAGPAADGTRAASELRDRLRCAMSVPFTADTDRPRGTDRLRGAGDAASVLDQVSASVGTVASSDVAASPSGRVDAHDLLREADHRMYAAKRRHHAARSRRAERTR